MRAGLAGRSDGKQPQRAPKTVAESQQVVWGATADQHHKYVAMIHGQHFLSAIKIKSKFKIKIKIPCTVIVAVYLSHWQDLYSTESCWAIFPEFITPE
jgi:hypothetical protein